VSIALRRIAIHPVSSQPILKMQPLALLLVISRQPAVHTSGVLIRRITVFNQQPVLEMP
jgi:hypothetical protein